MINTLRSKKVCKAAPLAGETKVWQYVTLIKKIYLIDCPGVVYPQNDTETDIILKGVVRQSIKICIFNFDMLFFRFEWKMSKTLKIIFRRCSTG